jgi:lysophospholipase L1-like esterase
VSMLLLGAGSPGGSSFDPSSLPGYAFGADAYSAYTDALLTTPCTASNNDVKGLLDLSGNGRHATWTAGGVPKFRVWGEKKAIAFNTANNRLATSSFFGAGYNTSLTLYIAQEYLYRTTLLVSAGANGTVMFLGNDASGGTLRNDWYTNGVGTRHTTWCADNRAVVAIRYNGATKRVNIRPGNGSADVVGSTAMTANLGLTGGLTIGALSTGGSAWAGLIYGVHVFNAVHADSEVEYMLAGMKDRFFGPLTPAPGAHGSNPTVVVCDGDSLTAGIGGTAYPTQLATLLGASYAVTQHGVSAQTLGEVMNDCEAQADLSISSSAVENVYVQWAGTNDNYYGLSADQIIGRITCAVERRLARGWDRVLLLTMLPRSDAGTPGTFESKRQTINTAIRAMATSQVKIVDVAADTRIGDAGDELDTTYYAADKVHMNTTGYGVIAQAVADVITA